MQLHYWLSIFGINENDIFSITKSLNINKICRLEKMSIWINNLWGQTIAIPLKIIFQSLLEEDYFLMPPKKQSIVPIHIEDPKTIFKRLIIGSLFNYCIRNKLFTVYISVFFLFFLFRWVVLLYSYQEKMKSTKVLIAVHKK